MDIIILPYEKHQTQVAAIVDLGFVCGVPSEDRARAYAEKNSLPLVYYSKRTNRMYYDRQQKGKTK